MKRIYIAIFIFIAHKGMGQLDSIKMKSKEGVTEKGSQVLKNNFYNKSDLKPKEFSAAEKANANPNKQMLPLLDQALEKQLRKDIDVSANEAVSMLATLAIGDGGDLEPPMGSSKKARLRGPSRFDSRIELRQFDLSEEWQNHIVINAASVGLVVQKQNLHPYTDSLFQLGAELTLQKKYNLCPNQAFAQQPVAGEGTAFIIPGGRFITAGHVLSGPVDQYVIVFGFEIVNKSGAYETLISASNIYYPKKIIEKDDEKDIVVIEVDRVPERLPLKISKKEPSLKDEIYMIGYPSGLPLKVSLNARVTSFGQRQYFYTSLDAFQGNSGSPVFSFKTHEVIGILVSGELDYAWTGSCNTTTLCTIPYCKGEQVIRISEAVKPADE